MLVYSILTLNHFSDQGIQELNFENEQNKEKDTRGSHTTLQ